MKTLIIVDAGGEPLGSKEDDVKSVTLELIDYVRNRRTIILVPMNVRSIVISSLIKRTLSPEIYLSVKMFAEYLLLLKFKDEIPDTTDALNVLTKHQQNADVLIVVVDHPLVYPLLKDFLGSHGQKASHVYETVPGEAIIVDMSGEEWRIIQIYPHND